MKKISSIIGSCIFAFFLLTFLIICLLKPETEFSNEERRVLKKLPEISVEKVLNGEFMDNFEEYSADQFPFREKFRSLKAFFSTKILNKKDNNGLFVAEGHISKIDDEKNESMMNYAKDKFNSIYETYLKDNNTKVYLSIVPDKNFILAKNNRYPSLDYDKFIDEMKNKLPYMEYIEVRPHLSLDDYYNSDTHWRQENIIDVARYINNSMGTDISGDYKVNVLNTPFNGVYMGQLALPFKPDTIKYLTNDIIDGYVVKYYDTGLPKKGDLYNMDKATGKDPYEMYLSGTTPIAVIENPNSLSDKELIMFRDSFGSSLAPILAEGFKKVTVVDIRYVQSAFLGDYIDFKNADVLFIYSSTLLNNSLALR